MYNRRKARLLGLPRELPLTGNTTWTAPKEGGCLGATRGRESRGTLNPKP